jgi:hypothetical protein
VYPSSVPGSTPIRDGFRLVTRQPSLVLGEIIWRWCFGAAFWVLLVLSFSEYLRSLPVSNLDWLMWKSGIPPLMSEAFGNTIKGSGYKLLRIATVLLPAYAVLWTFSASFGRAASLRSLIPDSAPRLRTLLGINFLRAALALAAIIGLIGAFGLATRAYAPRLPEVLPHPGRATAVVVCLGGFVWLVWSIGNWILGLATVNASSGQNTLGSVAAALRETSNRIGRYVGIGAAFGALHLLAFAICTWLVFMALSTASLLPGKVVVALLAVVTLAYFAVADFLYIARLASYVSLRFPVEAMTLSGPEKPFASGRSPVVQPSS